MKKRILSFIMSGLIALSSAASLTSCEKSENTYKMSYIDTSEKTTVGNVNDTEIKAGEEYVAIKIKGYDDEIIIKLYPEAAPTAVENFKTLINEKYYDDKKIHRVIESFMFQGGSKNGDGKSVAGEPKFDVETNYNMRHIYGALCMANASGINGTQFYIVNNKDQNVFTEFHKNGLNSMRTYANQVKTLAQNYKADKTQYKNMMVDYENVKHQISFAEKATQEVKDLYNNGGGAPSLDGGYTVFGQTIEGFATIDAVSSIETEYSVINTDGTPDETSEKSVPTQEVIIEKIEIRIK